MCLLTATAGAPTGENLPINGHCELAHTITIIAINDFKPVERFVALHTIPLPPPSSPTALAPMLSITNAATSNHPDELEELNPEPLSFLIHFKDHAAQHIHNAYEAEHMCHRLASGTLTTSLAEDVLSLVETQRTVVWNFLEISQLVRTEVGAKLFVDAMSFLLSQLKESQIRHRLMFLTTLKDACAAANDFLRMSEQSGVFLRDLLQIHIPAVGANTSNSSTLQQLGDALVNQFSQDAVYAAERTQTFIVRTIQQQTSIPFDLFSRSWEDDWTHNEVLIRLVNVFDGYLCEIKQFLANKYLYHKTLIISARAMVCFYIRCLVHKADAVGRHRHRLPGNILGKPEAPFRSPKRVLIRMRDDIGMISDFFEDKADGDLVLVRMIRSEVGALEVVHECLGATDSASLESFIVVIHKRTGADSLVTRHFVGDLMVLMARRFLEEKGSMKQTFEQLQPDLQMVTTRMKEIHPKKSDPEISFVRLDEMLKVLYEERIVHGLMPVCWTCLPKEFVEDSDDSVVTRRIRRITRNVAEFRWIKKPHRLFQPGK